MSGRPAAVRPPDLPYASLAVAALIQPPIGPRRRWLLLHRTDPAEAWDPPGGRMEGGEDLWAAVRREAAEETGLDLEVAGPCYAYLTFYKRERLLVVTMACKNRGDPEQVRLEPGGADAWKWVTTRQWEQLAAAGRSTWSTRDVRRATSTAAALWKTEDE